MQRSSAQADTNLPGLMKAFGVSWAGEAGSKPLLMNTACVGNTQLDDPATGEAEWLLSGSKPLFVVDACAGGVAHFECVRTSGALSPRTGEAERLLSGSKPQFVEDVCVRKAHFECV